VYIHLRTFYPEKVKPAAGREPERQDLEREEYRRVVADPVTLLDEWLEKAEHIEQNALDIEFILFIIYIEKVPRSGTGIYSEDETPCASRSRDLDPMGIIPWGRFIFREFYKISIYFLSNFLS
jgi:hypothetical protein